MVNKDLMDRLDRLGLGADIDALESKVAEFQEAAAKGEPMVPDSVYDEHFRLLRELRPQSEVLNRNWESEDNDFEYYDEMLKKYGMCSITTLTSTDELDHFISVVDEIDHPIDLFVSIKENGHGVRAVYSYGKLVSGSTRGRYKKGRDITRHLKLVLPNEVSAWEEIPIVEIRGEMLVSIQNFEDHMKGVCKTPLSSVTSLIRDSASDAEIKIMDMVCYKILASDDHIKFDTLWEEFKCLEENGFKVPEHALMRNVDSSNVVSAVERLLEFFEGKMDNGEIAYSCDGLVFAINDNNDFYSTGKNGNTWNGNFALKTGKYWASNIYSAIIKEIVWLPGKSYITPKAIIDPLVTATGAEVTNVPLYNVGVMERFHYIPGETIFFRFGGETGVTLTDYLGNSVSVTAKND